MTIRAAAPSYYIGSKTRIARSAATPILLASALYG